MTKAHSVSAVLLAEMKPETVGCSEVGTEARLKKSTEPDKTEVIMSGETRQGLYGLPYDKFVSDG